MPARVYASRALLEAMDDGVFEQIANVAGLAGIQRAAGCMPDGHRGYGFPIGGMAAMDADRQRPACADAFGVQHQAVVRSDLFLQLVLRDLAISEDLGKKAAANRLAPVKGNNGAAAVGMAEKVMAASDADEIETKTTQRLDDLGTGDCGRPAHAMTATR